MCVSCLKTIEYRQGKQKLNAIMYIHQVARSCQSFIIRLQCKEIQIVIFISSGRSRRMVPTNQAREKVFFKRGYKKLLLSQGIDEWTQLSEVLDLSHKSHNQIMITKFPCLISKIMFSFQSFQSVLFKFILFCLIL